MTRQQPAKARCSVQPTVKAVRKDMFAPRPRKKSFLLLEEFFYYPLIHHPHTHFLAFIFSSSLPSTL